MKTKPNLTISSLDLERIEALLEKRRNPSPEIEALETELSRANIVDPDAIPPNVVTMNSTVVFKELTGGKVFSLTLVYPQDMQTEDGQDKISVLAPVGSALLGLSIGDEIQWPRPGGGMMTLHIDDITSQPEREGKLYR